MKAAVRKGSPLVVSLFTKQQMGWSQRRAHLLLQIRTRVLDEEWENTFRRWYPYLRPRAQAKKSGFDPRESPALDNVLPFALNLRGAAHIRK